jgi:hypothetical protein
MVKQPGHLTSMKKERGAGTRVCRKRNRVNTPSNLHRAVFWIAFISYLELVLASLSLRSRVEEIDRENLLMEKISLDDVFTGISWPAGS